MDLLKMTGISFEQGAIYAMKLPDGKVVYATGKKANELHENGAVNLKDDPHNKKTVLILRRKNEYAVIPILDIDLM